MAGNTFANDNTAVRTGPVESVMNSNAVAALMLEKKRNDFRREVNNPNLTDGQVDALIYQREHPPVVPQLNPTKPSYRTKAEQERVNQEHRKAVEETKNINTGLRVFGYSDLSDRQAEQNPEQVRSNLRAAKADVAGKIVAAATVIPGMQWLRGAPAPLYYGANAAMTAASAKDWYDNGANFWNVSGTVLGGLDLGVPLAAKGFQNYGFHRAFGKALEGYKGEEIPLNTGQSKQISVTRFNSPQKGRYIFSERPSTLTEAEKAGIPRGERNNNLAPNYTQNILSMFPDHDASYIHTRIRNPDTKSFAEYLQSVGVDVQRLSDSELQQLMRMRQQSITHPAGEHGIMDTSAYGNYIQMFNDSGNIGDLEFMINKRNNTLGVSRIYKEKNAPSGFSRKAYDIGIDYAGRRGMKGIVSGDDLYSSEQTYRVWEHYPTRQIIGNNGKHIFNAGRDISKVGRVYSIDNGPVVLLPEPSAPVLPYKHLSFFHPAMIKDGTLQAPKWNVRSPFFSKGGKLKK